MTELQKLKGVGEKTAEKLQHLGLNSAEDLLFFLPKTYCDLTCISDLNTAFSGDFALFMVKITKLSPILHKGNRTICIATGEANGAKIKLIFYNRDYVLNAIKVGELYRVYGKFFCDTTKKTVENIITNPQFEKENPAPHLAGIVPIYATKGEVAQQTFRNILQDALQKNCIETALPNAKNGGVAGEICLSRALEMAHTPQSLNDAKIGCERIVLEKTFCEMLRFKKEYAKLRVARNAPYLCGLDEVLQAQKNLPFVLNTSQSVAIATIIEGFKQKNYYNGILTGDVGSGKTIVAFLAAYYIVRNKGQVVMMAPTELVAAQHFETAQKILAPLGVRCALLTSAVKSRARSEILKGLKNGQIDFILGTNAVLSAEVQFKNLAFAVVDEQHRFGVEARAALIKKSSTIDALFMTATPIPRTMKLLYLGEHEVIHLAPRYAYGNIKTRIVTPLKRVEMLQYLSENAKNGSLCYIIAPQICDMEGVPTIGAEEIYRDFVARFPATPAGILTGKMSFEQKVETAQNFRQGKIRVLVATTVVEVGLDVAGADHIAIMHADRLGLATLHQLRGRVGREGQEAYCFLYTEREDEVARLKILTQMDDGMRIAEADFLLRGAGEVIGTKQHGRDKILVGVTEDILTKAKTYLELQLL